MKFKNRQFSQVIVNAAFLLPIFVIILLVFLNPYQDILSMFLKPMVIGALQIIGVPAENLGNVLLVDNMEIPWSRDCSGFNQLLLLLGLVIWMRRHDLWKMETARIIAWAIPAALIANVARILTILKYRSLWYPQAESPEMHYLIGLVWILPFAALLLPTNHKKYISTWIELAHAVIVVSLLAPMVGAGESLAMASAAVLILAMGNIPQQWNPKRIVALVGWIVVGIGIATIRMGSFWLQWLLICPLMAQPAWFRKPRIIALILSTHPLFDLLPGGEWITWGLVGWSVWSDFLAPVNSHNKVMDVATKALFPAGKLLSSSVITVSIIMLSAPFVTPLLEVSNTALPSPPAIAEKLPIPGLGSELKLPGQPDTLGILWYTPSSYDRHHKLPVCMKYRGIHLEDVEGHPALWTDGTHWFREFFIQDKNLIPTHLQYVKATLGFSASPGIHLVFVARVSDMNGDTFAKLANSYSKEIHALSIYPPE